MRTKVISILAVVALYISLYFWSWLNVTLEVERDLQPVLAFISLNIFASFGLFLTLWHTIKWLLNK